MKTMFFAAVLVLGVAVLGGAQTAADLPQIHAASATGVGSVMHLSGNVEFTLGTLRVTADEADLSASHDISLSGNVHLITGPGQMRITADTRR